jgi:hypothetical protein
MTTREHFAITFAHSAYAVAMSNMLTREQVTKEDSENLEQIILEGAVKLADKLIAELEKGQPPKP